MGLSGGMHLLIVFCVTAAAVCTAARPFGPEATSPQPGLLAPKLHMLPAGRPQSQEYMSDYAIYHRLFMPPYMGYDEEPRSPVIPSDHEWLNKEIDRINEMDDEDDGATTYEMDVTGWVARDPILRRMFEDARLQEMHLYEPPLPRLGPQNMQLQLNPPQTLLLPNVLSAQKSQQPAQEIKNNEFYVTSKEKREEFALTPQDKGYFDRKKMSELPSIANKANGMHEGGDQTAMLFEPPRQIRQNPNLSKTKTLVADHLDRLRTGLKTKDIPSYRLPVSLLPLNLQWYNFDLPDDYDDSDDHIAESLHEEGPSTDKPGHVHILETPKDPAESIYGVALISAIGAAVAMAMFGFAIGWYTLFKKAKAAADVDYPAYGVTGPTIDSSGDRKLAHSAHMYHYQHQKQQIIAMERNGLEQRNGSVSDPESEEENEEGDYTVYECPGFATTGDMEVKNPLFSEDPTPATPGKCEIVKPQPKD